MSRFDAFAKSRASGRGLFRSWRGSREALSGNEYGISRRDVITRVGLVGGAAVVGSTLIESVTSPALAVSPVCHGSNATNTCGGTCPPCPVTQGCAQDADCEPGLYCNGTCQAMPVPLSENGVTCVSDRQCASFYCDSATHTCEANAPWGRVSPGGSCHAANQAAADLQCDGGLGTSRCVNGTCRSGNNGYCVKQSDCADPLICDTAARRCHYPP